MRWREIKRTDNEFVLAARYLCTADSGLCQSKRSDLFYSYLRVHWHCILFRIFFSRFGFVERINPFCCGAFHSQQGKNLIWNSPWFRFIRIYYLISFYLMERHASHSPLYTRPPYFGWGPYQRACRWKLRTWSDGEETAKEFAKYDSYRFYRFSF